jgi:tetratricopeptide (TPR) repeat protein
VELLTRTLAAEFPELDRERLQGAVERAVARAAASALDTEGYQVVDLHLARVEAAKESVEKAQILRELAAELEERGDAERSYTTRLAAWEEAPSVDDIEPLLRLAKVTQRWAELPLEPMTNLVDLQDSAAGRRLSGIAEAWQHQGSGYHAADCYERVLVIDPKNVAASEALEVFYRAAGEWPQLVDLLGRRAVHVASDAERAELFREIGEIYERDGDESAALDAYKDADRLVPGKREVLEAIARLSQKTAGMEEDALAALEAACALAVDPAERAPMLLRAAKLATMINWDKAQDLYERALQDAPDSIEAIDGLVVLLRDRGHLSEAVTLLVNSSDRPALAAERSRWLTDAGDYCVALGDTDWGKQLYRDARVADPQNAKAGVALVELCRDTGSLVELVPILDDLCRTTDDPGRLRGYLIQRSKVARELGDQTGARAALWRAVDLDPADLQSKRELGEMLFEAQQWEKARQVMEGLTEHEDFLGKDASVELHYRIARAARELGDLEGANKHAAISLALTPDHRPSLLLKEELDANDPIALTAHQLALANMAPPEEKAQRFTALGDRYIELKDRATAREMYREALVHKPGDHLLLTKFLELIADEGDWSYSLDLVRRLIETEKDPKVRARYGHLAGMIARDELDDPELSQSLLEKAVDDDPMGFAVADDLEALLETSGEHDSLAAFYYRRLEHVREQEGRAGERLRLWTALGELLLELGRHDDAVVAFEVAQTLAPDDTARRIRLVGLYEGDPNYDRKAIDQHHALLRGDKRRAESYKALHVLYERTKQPERAAAAEEASRALEGLDVQVVEEGIKELFGKSGELALAPKPRTISDADWLALSKIDVDLQLSSLFALVAPPFAAERARMRPPQGMPSREDETTAQITRVLTRVAKSFGITLPPVYIDRDQMAPCKLAMRVRDGRLVPVLLIGRPALDHFDDHELAFVLARQLADLRNDRIARLFVPRSGELAQIIELGMNLKEETSTGTSARWLVTSLHPLELDHVRTLGSRLRERNIVPLRAAVDWLAATERAADRIGFVVVGDLANCVRVLERDPNAQTGDVPRVLELVWSSITEELLAVRGRVEGWGS